jgi:hypothetical protein
LIKPDMPSAHARSRSPATIRSERRLGAGIAVSVLLHGLLLSLQFGVPGLDLGSGGPIAVTLAPPPSMTDMPSVPVSSSTPAASAPLASPSLPTPAVMPAPTTGLRLVDVAPVPPAPPLATKPALDKARPERAKSVVVKRRVREMLAPVIVAAPNPDSEFVVPLPDVAPEPLLAQETPEEQDTSAAPDVAQVASEEHAGVNEDAAELARLMEEEQRRLELEAAQEQERIVHERRATDAARQASALQAQQQLAEAQAAQRQRLAEEQALQSRQNEQRQAQEAALAARENAELVRERARQELALRQLAQERRAEEEALQTRADAQAEAQRSAREQAQRLAQEQQAERQRIEALSQQRLAQERTQQQADERARAERVARQQADQAARQAEAGRLQAQAQRSGPSRGPGDGQPGAAGAGLGLGGVGGGSGAGDRSQPGAMAGLPGSRARELLQGLTIPGAGAPLPTPAGDDPRRVVADGGERDAPLRLYVDSVRQKLERNAVLGGARLALRDVRIDPLVSLALRSDGSIDTVTIVRSSGRPDMDEAVRRFVQLNARYAAFPPNVAARFDVIEIRRIWRFTDSLKLLEEMR